MSAVIAMPRLATAAVLEDRRAMVQAARRATGHAGASARPPAPFPHPTRRQPSAFEQTVHVMTAWTYITPFLLAAPFFVASPLWIAALSQGRDGR